MKILVTGFEPFGEESQNPSQLIANSLDGRQTDRLEITGEILPVVRFAAIDRLRELIQKHQPKIVVALGVAVGRSAMTPEKVAINFDDFRIPDNQGNQPVGEPAINGAPTAYFSTLPINLMAQTMTKFVPTQVSLSAGAFVCNHVMFGLLHMCATEFPDIRAGFIHVPQATECCSMEAGKVPHFPIDTLSQALFEAIETAATHTGTDIAINAGDTH